MPKYTEFGITDLKEILVFIDLDDTIFQTKRKNINGIFPATETPNPENISYMTEAQKLFFEMLIGQKNTRIIPLTARNLSQYQRTFIINHELINTASIYFSGIILENNVPDEKWQEIIQNKYKKLKTPLRSLFDKVKKTLDLDVFKTENVDDFYIVIKNRDKKNLLFENQNKDLAISIKEKLDDEYFVHFNNNNIAILPYFLDKKFATGYLIEKYQPVLTLGIGDSLSDLNFMNLCDFKIIPSRSQIGNIFKNLDINMFY